VDDWAVPIPSPIEAARRLAAFAGLAALTLSTAGWVFRPDAFWSAYVFAWLLGASTTLGCLLLTAVAPFRAWDLGTQAVLRAGRRTVYVVAALAVPLALHGKESGAWIVSTAATKPVAALVRLVLVGPALGALSLALAMLAGLARHEPTVLSAAGERALRSRLVLLLATDAAALLALTLLASPWPRRALPHHGNATTLALAALEIALAAWLAPPGGARRLVPVSVLAFLAHAALLRRLLPPGVAMPGDAIWVPHALDLLLLAGLGGLWLALFLWRLDRQPPPPLPPAVDPVAGS
jgi:hypothetical protein